MLGKLEKAFIRLQFGAKARTRVYRKLVRFLGNSLSLTQALDIMYDHASDDGRKKSAVTAIILNEWRREVANGKKFGRAIQGWVPDSDRLVIEGGDEHGNLPVAIEKAILISTSSRRIVTVLVGGLLYPFLILASAIAFLAFFGTSVIPTFEQVMPRETWTGVGAQMAVMSDIVRNYLPFVLGAIAASTVAIVWSLPRWTGSLRVRFDRLPPWSLYRLTIGSGFLLSVAGMVRAGIPVPSILKMLQRDASPWYYERLQRTLRNVNNGANLGEALHRTGFEFPDKETVMDLRAYASLNRFDEQLERLGTEWLDESVSKIEAQTAVMKTAALILMGFVFMWVVAGIGSLQLQIMNTLG